MQNFAVQLMFIFIIVWRGAYNIYDFGLLIDRYHVVSSWPWLWVRLFLELRF